MPTTSAYPLALRSFLAVDNLVRGRKPSLRQIMHSFSAPRFPTLAEYGNTPEPEPTVAEVIAEGERVIAWHTAEIEKGGPESLLRHHSDRIAYVRDKLNALTPLTMAAE